MALIILVGAASSLMGVLSNINESFFIRAYQVVHDVQRANPYALAVGLVTVLSGLLVRRRWRRDRGMGSNSPLEVVSSFTGRRRPSGSRYWVMAIAPEQTGAGVAPVPPYP